MRPLCILVMGDPVPTAHRERGDFALLMRESIGEHWTGPWLTLDCREQPELPEPNELSGILVTGSPSSVTDREDWVVFGERYLRRAVQVGAAVLGVCFGHQMLAQALGGHVSRNPRGREIGTVELSLVDDTDPVLSDPARPYLVNMSHTDSVERLPPGARILGRTSRDPHAALRFAATAWGVQFHPEFDREIVGHYAHTRSEDLRREGIDPERVSLEASDAAPGAGVLRRFVAAAVRAG
jgi:GMP synthase (glutamine-hydrolysing)